MRAPQPEPPIPGSFATPSLLAWIVNGKYVMSLPLYRIETDLKACGATISRQDMAVCVQLVVAGLVTMIFRV
ncbi:IS66 family transposase [Bifidobacterium longum]|uniref:IS66 family transposase n=1 Tax=Bifidobacterium longum TaxID=216816 RepID=UPI001F6224E5|nr:transposase [Bifidobacterium longum]